MPMIRKLGLTMSYLWQTRTTLTKSYQLKSSAKANLELKTMKSRSWEMWSRTRKQSQRARYLTRAKNWTGLKKLSHRESNESMLKSWKRKSSRWGSMMRRAKKHSPDCLKLNLIGSSRKDRSYQSMKLRSSMIETNSLKKSVSWRRKLACPTKLRTERFAKFLAKSMSSRLIKERAYFANRSSSLRLRSNSKEKSLSRPRRENLKKGSSKIKSRCKNNKSLTMPKQRTTFTKKWKRSCGRSSLLKNGQRLKRFDMSLL